MINIVSEESGKRGMTINFQKTSPVVCTKKIQVVACCLMGNVTRLEQKGSFIYLGSWITSDRMSDKYIKCKPSKEEFYGYDEQVLYKENWNGSKEKTISVVTLVSANV